MSLYNQRKQTKAASNKDQISIISNTLFRKVSCKSIGELGTSLPHRHSTHTPHLPLQHHACAQGSIKKWKCLKTDRNSNSCAPALLGHSFRKSLYKTEEKKPVGTSLIFSQNVHRQSFLSSVLTQLVFFTNNAFFAHLWKCTQGKFVLPFLLKLFSGNFLKIIGKRWVCFGSQSLIVIMHRSSQL